MTSSPLGTCKDRRGAVRFYGRGQDPDNSGEALQSDMGFVTHMPHWG